MEFTFHQIETDEEIPYELLLLADETIEAIHQYIFRCDVYVLKKGQQSIAVMALFRSSDTELEIKNIAVADPYQNKGIGGILIRNAKKIAKQNHYSSLLVGTSDTGFQQIRFYEKNGFVKKTIRKDFFIENYPAPIFENDLQMRDMIVLEFLTHNFPE
ncbi:GNAT family N-acetyltransferase [Chryseobacterium sp. T16E-39]|uniref:GNAT family N-acetyltransferase n=1 Tax=Chryseobacterium sp. T16E-39 TaxID=2015076 RepID=UPI000B5B3194|nr:GNAT family N-acetyltransferase [Chryseobacterium sp. T16E-39]ASK32113.1 GNAT family N-acetyltransferase [Chryseobacterium sp. T16E-39]